VQSSKFAVRLAVPLAGPALDLTNKSVRPAGRIKKKGRSRKGLRP